MKGRGVVATTLIAMFVFSSVAFGVEVPSAAPVPCIAPGMNGVVVAQIPAGLTTTFRPRLYFKANGQTDEYYVEMQRGPNGWWAVLPQVADGTTSVTYRVGGINSTKTWIMSEPVTVNTTTSCAPEQLTRLEKRTANNLVLGMTNSTQPTVPVGFSCVGIVSIITVAGRLEPATECHKALVAAGLPAGAVVGAGGGVSAGTIAALTVGAVAAGLVIYNNTKGHHHQVSPSRP